MGNPTKSRARCMVETAGARWRARQNAVLDPQATEHQQNYLAYPISLKTGIVQEPLLSEKTYHLLTELKYK